MVQLQLLNVAYSQQIGKNTSRTSILKESMVATAGGSVHSGCAKAPCLFLCLCFACWRCGHILAATGMPAAKTIYRASTHAINMLCDAAQVLAKRLNSDGRK